MRTGYVYFIRPIGMEGPVKIGFSAEPKVRSYELTSFSPFPLEVWAQVEAKRTDEARIQAAFYHQHTHGEWFTYTPEIAAVVARIESGEAMADILATLPMHGKIRSKFSKPIPKWQRCSTAARCKMHAARKRMDTDPPHSLFEMIERAASAKRVLTDAEQEAIARFCLDGVNSVHKIKLEA